MAHYLKTDIQTRFDLGIQETPNGERPLSLLFLQTETKEGKRMMRNWIAQPLSDLTVILEWGTDRRRTRLASEASAANRLSP